MIAFVAPLARLQRTRGAVGAFGVGARCDQPGATRDAEFGIVLIAVENFVSACLAPLRGHASGNRVELKAEPERVGDLEDR